MFLFDFKSSNVLLDFELNGRLGTLVWQGRIHMVLILQEPQEWWEPYAIEAF